MDLKAVLEGLLFVSGEDGMTKEKVISILEISSEEFEELMVRLIEDYSSNGRGITIGKFGDKYKLITKKEHSSYYKKLVDDEISENLSRSALETLAIVAYNQPITRVMIDEIRGVSTSHIVRKLVFKNLIKEVGRSELPGRPILYGVTDQFLDYFGLTSIDDLPKIEMTSEEEETELYNSKYVDEEE